MKQIILLILALLAASFLYGAVGCDLNDPAKDIKRFFPDHTGYKTYYRSIQRDGGKALLTKVETRLGDKFTGLFETIDVPYTIYEVFKGDKLIGYVHGVNQKGRYGGIQVFLVLSERGIITQLYFQRLSSRNGNLFKARTFTSQFAGLSVKDFDTFDIVNMKGTGKVTTIKNPAPDNDPDFAAIMRGIKKNLVLMEHFGRWGSL
ncbi:MAG: hypothetical protein FJ042_04000 [Candidatus Cloacimonetes bacterium]|nr:hypothetical protein [Candidatus Cloacimonadota bacterium]